MKRKIILFGFIGIFLAILTIVFFNSFKNSESRNLITLASPACNDTDDQDIHQVGSCTDTCGGPYTDYCYSEGTHVFEYYCSGDSCTIAFKECPNGECCSGGKCNGVAGSCSDSDDGQNSSVAGSCTDSCHSKSDYCYSSNKVMEFYCNSNKHCAPIILSCPSGTKCENGKCVPGGGGVCSDSDNNDIHTQGTCTDSDGTHTDYCYSEGTHVFEYYCSGDSCTIAFKECPNGECCSGGKCNGVAGSCSDSDDGQNSSVAGSCTDSCHSKSDYCYSSNKVMEFYCNSNKHCAPIILSCPSGSCCKDGKCSPANCECTPGETRSCGNCGIQTCKSDGTWGDCQPDPSKCSGNCATCKSTDGGQTYNCAPDNTKCANTASSCYCSGSDTTFNCVACSSSGCCDAACSNYSCVLKPNDANCPSGQTCNQNCQCVTAACTDECSPSGSTQYRCSGDTVQQRTCGNYDADPCLEWSSWSNVENCNDYDGCYSGYYRNYYCSGGSCTYTSSCTENCCDQYYGDSNAYCSGGTCYPPPSCSDECSPSGATQYQCSGTIVQKRTCGNYDADSCLEWSSWSNVENCNDYDGCYSGYYRDYYCSAGSCNYNQSCTENCCDQYYGNSNAYCSGGTCYPPPNQPPTASFSCDSSLCAGGDGSNCIMYQPISDINTCIFKLVNNSSDPDGSISQTKWYIKKKTEPDSSYREIGSCSGKCNHTIQITDVPDPATYTVKLSVQDNQGAWASITRDLIVKKEISAAFACSLDNSNWKPCGSITLFPGQTIFVKDYSSPSEGATINSWTWQKGDGTNFETFAQGTPNASTTLTISQKYIRLIVSDTASRSDRQDHRVSVTYPLPFFREISEIFFKMRDFFASLISKVGNL